MNRLTKDLHNQYKDYWYREDLEQVCDREQIVLTELGLLEDIEDEIGMDLKIFHKLMNMLYCGKHNMLYVKDKDTIVQVSILEIDYCKKKIIFYKDSSYNDDYVYGFAQYGKTWALTKEELVHKEKEKC